MYKLIEWISMLTMSTEQYPVNESEMASNVFQDISAPPMVNRKRHAKYFQRCLDVLPPRLASHDSTRYELVYLFLLVFILQKIILFINFSFCAHSG